MMLTEDNEAFVKNCIAYISGRIVGEEISVDDILTEGKTEDTYFLRFDMDEKSVTIMHEISNEQPKKFAFSSLYSEMARSFIMYGLYYISNPITFKERQYTENNKRKH